MGTKVNNETFREIAEMLSFFFIYLKELESLGYENKYEMHIQEEKIAPQVNYISRPAILLWLMF